ncbi:hypothetical protein BH09BAC1_BH09BAC1_05470 [soil metagenome]
MKNIKPLAALLILILLALSASAHTINYHMEAQPMQNVVWYYLWLGFEHIIPYGLDHILFVIGICLLSNKLSTLLWQATAFTVAHTITLILSMKGIIEVPAAIIEPIIALSIAFIAIENMLISQLKPWRIAVIFLFGLIHGMGFASALNELGLPRNAFYTSLITFNIGVELGQAAVILAMYFGVIYWFGQKVWYRKFVVYPVSTVIAITAIYWTITRVM